MPALTIADTLDTLDAQGVSTSSVGQVSRRAGASASARTPDPATQFVPLAPAFTLLNDRTGRLASPETMRLYAEHFRALHLSVADVYAAVREICVGWQAPYWPTADRIAQVAARLNRAGAGDLASDRMREMDEASRACRDDRYDRLEARAAELFRGDPVRGRQIIARVDREMNAPSALGTTGVSGVSAGVASNALFRKAARDTAIISAIVQEMG